MQSLDDVLTISVVTDFLGGTSMATLARRYRIPLAAVEQIVRRFIIDHGIGE